MSTNSVAQPAVNPGIGYPAATGVANFIIAAGTSLTSGPLFIADRDMVIDEIVVRWDTANTSTVRNLTIQTVGDTVAPGSGTDFSTALSINGTANTLNTLTLDRTKNRLVKGEMLGWKLSGAPATAALISVAISWRRQIG